MKIARQSKILELIAAEEINTQEELAKRLNESGHRVTQATVSRDIRELQLTKSVGMDGRSRYVKQQGKDQELGSKYIRVFRNSFVSMDTAQNLLVIHTVSGMAMAAAAALDDIHLPQIIGCIAGDNTIMCATKSPKDAQDACEQIEIMINGR